MTLLVTGGSGLVGSHVIAALRGRGEPVRALARGASRSAVEGLGAEAVVGDVTDPAAWRAAARGVRAIVHSAALVQRRETWEHYVAVNVDATRLAVEAARATGARLVHVSSVAVYGGSAAYRPEPERRTEDDPFRPIAERDFYARTKRMAEQVVRDAAVRGALTAVALRPTVVYGERDRLFTPRAILAVRLGLVPRIGPGTNHLACVYAGNVAGAAVAALDAPISGFRAYNVASDAPPRLTQREFITALAEALGTRVRTIPIPAGLTRIALGLVAGPRLARAAVAFLAGENPHADDRARAELGWQPAFAAREAVRRTVSWFLENEKPGH